jgi:hypothetical protein
LSRTESGRKLGEPDHLIVNFCPAVSFVDAEVFALTSAGVAWSIAAQLMRRLIAAARAGETYEQGRDILIAYQDEPWYARPWASSRWTRPAGRNDGA